MRKLIAIAALAVCAGCSTGKVSLGLDFSCVAFSIKPAVEFDGVSWGRENIIVTNMVCNCAGAKVEPEPQNETSPIEEGGTK